MTSSNPSPEPDPAGFAAHSNEGDRIPLSPFVQDMRGPLGGVFVQDMPAGKPQVRPRPKVKGVPGPSGEVAEDYRPGGGTWRDAT